VQRRRERAVEGRQHGAEGEGEQEEAQGDAPHRGHADLAAHGRPFAAGGGSLPAGRARLGIAVPQRSDLLATGPPGGATAAPVARQG
jgi:hypothetical protein